MSELPKTFDPAAIEARWYAHWESGGLFRPDRGDCDPWTIVMPPPNVTGSLHIGHALDITLQDVLTRRERMRGRDALWVVGTDHAGIATQMVVERQLVAEQKVRTDFTREQFVERVWAWKEESGGAITRQLRRLGASCDWANERFTMDEGFSKAVTKVFVELHKRGLLYRDKRLVNWDPKFETAISDLEVETRDVQGKFWTLRYPLADGTGSIEVATTRPETMLADMAVAVHPGDERYAALIGRQIKLPISGRLIPIIADDHADPELGSGAVKITPGHDFNDYEVGKRAGFKPGEMLNMFDGQARVVQPADGLIPAELVGMTRDQARTEVVARLEAEGALVRVEDRTIPTPFGDRSGVVIEPWLTDQWYVDAAKLAGPAIEAVKSGAIKIVPETWAKTWFNWLENIQPWCVSRQLWWGHRIPAWFDADGNVFVAESAEEAQAEAGQGVTLRQDEDVLDTWFSSALWPFATLGWPEDSSSPLVGEAGGGRDASASPETLSTADAAAPPPRPSPQGGGRQSDLSRHYPNDVLISGFDILFFWDARMAMQGIEFMGRSGTLPLEQSVPWKTLYLHGLVRDAAGQKMSKSKGNSVDPLGLIDKYGADALRFTLAAMESQGRDIKLDEKRVEGYRNFATKLWNAARFLQMNGISASTSIAAPAADLPVNRWIIGEVVETLAKLDRAFDELRFDDMADAIYHFVWGTFCDWYVELIKGELSPLPSGGGEEARSAEGVGESESDSPTPSRSREREGSDETRRVAAWAFDQILVMLHPLMPFITEELWSAMGKRPYELIVAKWPAPEAQVDRGAKYEMEWLIGLIVACRSARAESQIPAGAKGVIGFKNDSVNSETRERLIYLFVQNGRTISRLACIETLIVFESGTRTNLASGSRENRLEEPFAVPGSGLSVDYDGISYTLGLEGFDLDAERARLNKSVEAAEKERDSLAQRLANPNFTERAKPEAVEKARADHDAKSAESDRLRAALEKLA